MADYPDETQWNQDETSEEKSLDIEIGEKEEDVSTEEGREKMMEGGEIAPWEEGFLEGAEEVKGELGECAHCGKVLNQNQEEVVEREINGELVWFCSDTCASKGPKEE